ncbi:AraC family transcriptional regulator [Paenibacillus lemnae]|uniref:AraC family transcriptional regulator n=1 Tax=Paenibacillus lemnae TaxID=1330551 RepID=A0A848M2L6_PAELE|nr:AraC family transcriptional regulator [Paenibacillus lemnae]NMO95147.1 AraC family transcriptional regulator [Paenibacillus lemnae]
MMKLYNERIQSILQYIAERYTHKITLDELAAHAHFSKYHFSRIFASIVGETPMAYVNQVRLDRAGGFLADTERTILDIAQDCGFESITAFHTAFKKKYGITPGEFRKQAEADRNFTLSFSKNLNETALSADYDESRLHQSFFRRVWDMNITITELPEHKVAYVRHVGSYLETYRAWEALNRWSAIQGLFPPKQQFIGISLDDPAAVEESECRYDACVTVPDGFHTEGQPENIQFQSLAGGTYARYHFYDTVDKLTMAYHNLFGQWLPISGYDADDRPCLEFCMNNPAQDPEGKAKVDLYIPIVSR